MRAIFYKICIEAGRWSFRLVSGGGSSLLDTRENCARKLKDVEDPLQEKMSHSMHPVLRSPTKTKQGELLKRKVNISGRVESKSYFYTRGR